MEMQEENRDWSIGQLARYSGLSVKTVRFYTDSGLLVSDRSAAGHRRYGPTDLVRLTLIRGLRSLDVGLDTISQLLAGVTDLQHCLRVQEQVLQLRLLTVRRQLAVCRASAQDGAGRHGDRLLALTRIEAAERDRLLERFWDQVLSTPADPAGAAQMRTAGTPELPPEPTAEQVLTVTHPADVVVTDNADGSCGFGRHGDADRREVTPVLANLCRDRRHGDGRLRAREDSAGPDFRSADSVRSAAHG